MTHSRLRRLLAAGILALCAALPARAELKPGDAAPDFSAPAAVGNRFGLATWAETDAHFLYARAYALATVEPFAPFAITNISLAGGNVVLNISKPASWNYDVLSAATVLGPWTTNAVNQSAAQYSEPAPGSGRFYRLQKSP